MGFESKQPLLLGKLHSFPQTAVEKKLYSVSKLDDAPPSPSTATSPTYTSLKDLIPSNRGLIRSPSQVKSAHEIPISNFLVKKAAWAYLQPMLEPSGGNGGRRHIFVRIWDDLMSPANACLQFIKKHIIVRINRAFDMVVAAMAV